MNNVLEIGQIASISKTVSENDILLFAEITGDYNPIHFDEDIAKESVFKRRIAQGMLTGSFISGVLGMQLPGPGTIYLEQNLKFLKPIFLGEIVTVTVTVSDILNEEKGIYKLDTVIVNETGETVTEGYAVVKYCIK